MSRYQTMYDAIMTALAAIDGTGSYTQDVSDADSRLQGYTDTPPVFPFLQVFPLTVPSRATPNTTQLNQFDRVLTFGWQYMAAIEDPKTQYRVGLGLINDVQAAMAVDRTHGDTAIDVFVDGEVFDGGEISTGIARIAMAGGTIRLAMVETP